MPDVTTLTQPCPNPDQSRSDLTLTACPSPVGGRAWGQASGGGRDLLRPCPARSVVGEAVPQRATGTVVSVPSGPTFLLADFRATRLARLAPSSPAIYRSQTGALEPAETSRKPEVVRPWTWPTPRPRPVGSAT